jgi:Uncharacterized Fe-S protein
MQTGSTPSAAGVDLVALAARIKGWATELGFAKAGIAGIELEEDEARLLEWLRQGRHGSMDYMASHGRKRSRPAELQPGTLRVISARMDYFPCDPDADAAWATLRDGARAYIARYALGRDYHKLIRNRLQKLADRIAAETGPFGYRAFVDSAPVLERRWRAMPAGLDRQAHRADQPPRRLVLLSGRAVHRPAVAGGRTGQCALRQLLALHRGLSDPGDPRAVQARCAALHLLPHHRAQGLDSRGTACADR